MRAKQSIIILLTSIFLLEGCVVLPPKQNFKKIFYSYMPRVKDNPVIIVPGIIGSRLINLKTKKMVWGSVRVEQVFFLSERDSVALPINKLPISRNRDNIVSKGIIDKYEFPISIIQFKVYRELLDMFEEVGYRLGDINNPKPDDTLFVFDYDWRRDNVESAILLSKKIENIKKSLKKPDLKFNLVCHSMGGLIGRYYMRYGGNDILGQYPDFKVTYEGAKNIKRLILIGVPNLGSVSLFKFLHKGLDLMVAEYLPYVLFTMPSVYQLLPVRDRGIFIDENGNDLNIDLYDIENWKKFGWSIYSEKMLTFTKSRFKLKFKDDWESNFNKFAEERDRFVRAVLERTDRFHKSLTYMPKKIPPCKVILFGGDTEWTLDKVILKKDKTGKWRTSFWDPRLRNKLLKPGDTMVTRESLLGFFSSGTTKKRGADFPMYVSFWLFVPQRHENIHKDATFQDNLLHILLEE